MKNVMSPIPQVTRTRNLTGQWVMTRDQHSKNHTTVNKNSFMKFFPAQNCTFNLT